jgi:hypothetical protein
LLGGSIENWMPIKCQRVSKQKVGAEGSGPALVDSSICGESTPVDLDLKNPKEEWARVASWCGAHLGGSKSNTVNLILRLFFVPFFTYDELVTSRVHPQQHRQPTNTTTMVMEPLAPPAAWIQ